MFRPEGNRTVQGGSISEHRMAPEMSSLSAWRQIFSDHASAMSKRPKSKISMYFQRVEFNDPKLFAIASS